MTNALGKIAIRPKTIPPQKFLQFRKFFPECPTRTSFQYLYYSRYAVVRLYLHDQMDMISLQAHLAYLPPVYFACLRHQLSQPYSYLTSQHTLSVLRYSKQMHLQTMLCPCTCPIFGHGQIMPKDTSAPPASAGFALGSHSSPSFKARGGMAVSIKWTPNRILTA